MPWNTQGGGGSPWGSGGGSSSGGGGRGQGPWGSGGGGFGGPQPPNLEEMLRRGQDKLKSIMPGGVGSSRGIVLILLLGIAIWLASGFYRVQPDEQGVVLRFGQWVRTTQPGLNYHLPSPIESALTPRVTAVNRVDIGFRSAGATATGVGTRNVPEESLMLTGDENIVDINFVVFWVINDAGKFLFNIRNPEQTVKAAAESAMREIIGRTNIQPILAEGRQQVETDTQRLLQQILDNYGSGIQVTQLQMQRADPPPQVVDAFRDVQSARADLERQRNEAEAYRNDLLPRARGEAAKIVQEGEGYKRQTVARAEGDSSRFLSLYNEYRSSPQITRQRLYLETMQEVLSRNPAIIIDSRAGASGVVPYLALPEIQKRSNAARGTAPAGTGTGTAVQGGSR